MKRSLSMLSVFVLLAVAMLPVQANAAVNLNAGTGTVTFASELCTGATTLGNTTNDLDATAQLGFSIAQGTSKYVRFDLNNGAKFNAGIGYSILDDSNLPAQVILGAGGNGSSFVIYEITGVTNGISPTKVGTLTATSFLITGPTPVTMKYALYPSANAAIYETTPLATLSATWINFASGMSVGKNAVTPLKIDVLADSKKFEGGFLQTIIGSVYATVNTTVHKLDGSLLAPGDIGLFVGANTALEVTGDFTATGYVASNVWLDDNATSPCASGTGTPATTLVPGTPNKATFVVHQTPITNPTAVCMKVNGTTAIVPTTFYGLYNTNGGVLPNVNLDILSTLVKNSKALQSSWINATSANGKSQFYLTNMGGSDVQFTTKAFTEDGRTVTVLAPFNAPYAIKAGKSVVINVNSMLQWSGGNRFAAVVFEFLGSAANIQGAYRYYNYTTGMMVDEPLWQPYTD